MATDRPAIKLLACDIDGTLLRNPRGISDRVREAVARAQAAGVIVALATGRMPAAAGAFVRQLNLEGPQIFSNGALVQTSAGDVLIHVEVPSEVATRVVSYCTERVLHLNLYVGDNVYVAKIGPESDFTKNLNRITPVEVAGLFDFARDNAPTKMVVVRLPAVEPGLVEQIASDFKGDLFVSSSVPQYVEMVSPLVDKGRALRELARLLDFTMDQVAAIGAIRNILPKREWRWRGVLKWRRKIRLNGKLRSMRWKI